MGKKINALQASEFTEEAALVLFGVHLGNESCLLRCQEERSRGMYSAIETHARKHIHLDVLVARGNVCV